MDTLCDCDYKIIVIDSSCSKFISPGVFDFYIDLDEPLRNVFKLNVITILLNINNTGIFQNSLESIFIDLNNYRRLISKSNTLNIESQRNNDYYFDSIIIETANTTGTSTIKNDYNNADTVYYLNPLEPQLKRFSIRLCDKNNTILTTSLINKFVMKLGVYYNNKKTTRI